MSAIRYLMRILWLAVEPRYAAVEVNLARYVHVPLVWTCVE